MLNITAQTVEFLTELHDEDDIRTDYSGRAMYGNTCLAYTGENMVLFAMDLAESILRTDEDEDYVPSAQDIRDTVHELGDPRVDQMGRGLIYYWTNVTVTESE